MSADNGVYILKTKAEDHAATPFEYRVIHTANIEEIYWDAEGACYREDGRFTPEVAFEYFWAAPVFTSSYEAWEHAKKMAASISVLEYGIGMLEHGDQLFQSFTPGELEEFFNRAEKILEQHRRDREEKRQRDLEARTVRLPAHSQVEMVAGTISFLDEESGKTVRAQVRRPISFRLSEELEVLKIR
ncbi:MAG: hypothetical protein GF334_03275 [Candidatus Altiarchaeales archaeon]|nr:hypothetical protein [Candidatus Altiarchaeales archaeon]